MNYPLISEYIEAIKSADDNFAELSYLRAVLGDDGLPIMTSGNFAVVFKMKDETMGKLYALKCFTKEQQGREEAYHQIAEELKNVDSPYLVSLRYLEKELFVDTEQTDETEFPVLLMDWVEGKTLDKYLRENLNNKYALEMLAYRFSQLAQWLIPQPFAHGDLKPDNILVREDGTLVLVDYDGMYVPTMKGQKARELGSPDFRHPLRTENDFDEHIDDFPLVSILLSLKLLSIDSNLWAPCRDSTHLVFSDIDYRDISACETLKNIFPSKDNDLNLLLTMFTYVLEQKNFIHMFGRPFDFLLLHEPEMPDEEVDAYIAAYEDELLSHKVVQSWSYIEFAKKCTDMEFNYAYYPAKRDMENACYFKRNDGKDVVVFNLHKLTEKQLYSSIDMLRVSLMNTGYYILTFDLSQVIKKEIANGIKDEFGVTYSKDGRKLLKASPDIICYKIKEGTKIICDSSFRECKLLHKLDMPNSVEYIGKRAFWDCFKLNSVILSNNLKIIEDNAFYQCMQLKEIIIPESTTNIGSGAFLKCYSLQRIKLSKNLSAINDNLFTHCTSLNEIIIPDNITKIADYAFSNCKSLQTISIPDSVLFIGEGAFSLCESLREIRLPKSLETLGLNIFFNCNHNINVISYSPKFKFIDHVLYDIYNHELLSFLNDSKVYAIPNFVTKINEKAFDQQCNLKSLTIGDSVTSIGKIYFYSDIKSVLIPLGKRRRFEVLLPNYKEMLVEI